MPIHREGYSTLTVIGAILVVLNGLTYLVLPRLIFVIIAGVSIVILALIAQFFRNPVRVITDCAACVITPADGTIVAIETMPENEFFHDERLKLSIYMSIFNVHLNRVPISGKVIYTRYHPGRYLVAFHPKASELNERNTVVVGQSDGQQILMRQIAGFMARRIRFYLHDGQIVRAGEELGFIKFGSRCDVFLPLDADVRVQMGQKVKGGQTMLAKLRENEPLL